jgi:hypothetical protein
MEWLDRFSTMVPGDFASASVAPMLLLAIAAVHVLYYRLHLGADCQQSIAVEDLSTAPAQAIATVVRARSTEFDAANRSSQPALLEVPQFSLPESRRPFARLRDSRRFAGGHVNQTLVFREDLELSGRCTFHRPVKVGGDLVVEGEALFLAPVVVNGTLKVIGTAHFAAGVIAKDDALVRGTLNVGSDAFPGWAVLRDLLLARRLGLNGTLVANSAIQLKDAA